MRKQHLVIIAIVTALGSLAGCFGFVRGNGPVEAFQFLESRNPGLGRTVTGTIAGYGDPVEITAVVPPGSRNLVATFTLNTEARILVVNDGRPVVQQNGITRNDFSVPVLYSIQVPGERQPWRYRVTVREADTDAALSRISLAGGLALVPRFNPTVRSYTVEVPWAVRKVRLEAEGRSPRMADIAIDGAGSGGSLAGATVEFTAAVTQSVSIETLAEDGTTRDAYTVTLRRLPADGNARLDSLAVDGAALAPAFSPTRTAYRVEVPFDATGVVLKARPQSALATVSLLTYGPAGKSGASRSALAFRGDPADRAGATVSFPGDASLAIIVAVTAEDGGVQEYVVEVARTEPDHDNTLADLAVDTGRLAPAFDARVLAYTVEVPFAAREIGIAARAASALAGVAIQPGPTNTAAPFPAVRGDVTSRNGAVVTLPATGRLSLAVAVTAQDGRVRQYVVEVRRAAPDANADLGALSVSAGVLAPAFTPRVVSYTVSLPANVESVRLTATAASALAAVTVEDSAARPAVTQAVTLAVAAGATETVNLVVTAEDGSEKLYRVRVSREAPLPVRDGNTRLARLELAGAGLAPAFRPEVLDYEATLAAHVSSVTLTAMAESPVATIAVDGRILARTGRVITLEPGASKTVVIDVTAENGAVARTILWLSRERAARDGNARLAFLQLAGAALAPAFNPLVLDYEARLAVNTPSVTLTAGAESPAATVDVDGQPLARTGRVIALEPGATRLVIIDVTAANGTVSTTTLWLARERAAGRDTNTRLERLQLVGATLEPSFDPRVLEYAATIAADAGSVILFASAESPVAAIAVDGQPLARTGRAFAIEPGGAKTVRIDVTAESGAVARTTVRLSREVARDANTRLARLQLAGAALVPAFDPRVSAYEATLAVNTPSVVLTAAAESPRATIAVDGQPLARTGRVIALEPGTARTVIVDVTAESGAVARTFLRLAREAARDANTRLARLQLAGAVLVPAFDPRVSAYEATLAAATPSVTLTAAAESPAATIEVDGQPLARTGRVIALEPGTVRTVIVDVTAESGAIARTFLRLSREAARDTNARLARLQLAGAALAPAFDPRVLAYTATLAAATPSVTLTAAAESPAATIAVDGQPLARTGRVIALEPGTTRTVTIDVTAESGAVARTLVRVSREAGGQPPGGDRVTVTLDDVKIGAAGATGSSSSRGAVGEEATIVVRYYRTGAVIARGTAPVTLRMQGTTPVLSATWRSPGLSLQRGRLVEIEVSIPAGGSNWLHYAEARWADEDVRIDVPFLVSSRAPQVSWPATGSPVSVAGFVAVMPGGSRSSTAIANTESLETNAKGEYGVEVVITDASGRVLARDTVWAKPGLPSDHLFAFSRPVSLPEGATVRYVLTAKGKNGRAWTASGTAEVWTTRLAEDGGFEPVVLEFGEELRQPR